MATSLLPPAGEQSDLVQLGTTQGGEPIVLTQEALCSGCYLVGVQGTGKSSLLEQIAAEQMRRSVQMPRPESLIVLDAHGQTNLNISARIPQQLLDQGNVLHLDIRDEEHPFPFNPFRCKDPANPKERRTVRDSVLRAFAKLWPEVESQVYFKDMLYLLVSLLLACPDLTLKNVKRLLTDAAYRALYVQRLARDDEEAAEAWDEYEHLRAYEQERRRKPFLTRIDELVRDDVIRKVLCHPSGKIDLRQVIEQGQILLITLPVNEPGYQTAAKVIGTFLLSAIYETTFSFVDLPEGQRPGFTLMVDEFQNFATSDYAILFSQGRKYGVKQILAHQYRSQLDEMGGKLVKDGTLTAHTRVVFRVNDTDALELSRKFTGLRRRPTILLTNPTERRELREHQSQIVREFYRDVVKKLEDAARMRANTQPESAAAALSALNACLYECQKQAGVVEDALQRFMAAYGQFTGSVCLSQAELQQERREAEAKLAELTQTHEHYLSALAARHAGRRVSPHSLVQEYTRKAAEQQAKLASLRSEISRKLTEKRAYFLAHVYGSTEIHPALWQDVWQEYRLIHCAFEFELRHEGMILRDLDNVPETLLSPDGRFYEVLLWSQVANLPGNLRPAGVLRDYGYGARLWVVRHSEFVEHKRQIEALVQELRSLEAARSKEEHEAWQLQQLEYGLNRQKQEIELRLAVAEAGQRVRASLRAVLVPVITALIDDPIAADETQLSAPEIATLLQTLPNRQAVVAIGARVTAMETVDLATRGDKVAAAVATQREHQIKAVTFARYDLRGQRAPTTTPAPTQPQGMPPETREEAPPPRAAQAAAEGEALPELPLPAATPTTRPTNQTVPRVAKRRREPPSPPPPQSLERQNQEWRPYDEV